MAPTIDISNWFDQETFSDVTLKFSDRQLKCHKIILSNASDYFKTLLKPDGAFAESKEGAVELKEDPPAAVEAMIRHIYSFEYIATNATGIKPPREAFTLHLDVYKVAHKYLVEDLQQKAMDNISTVIPKLFADRLAPPEAVFADVKCLADCRDHDKKFAVMMEEMVRKYLKVLIDLKEFRVWLEHDGDAVRHLMVDAVKLGAPALPQTPAQPSPLPPPLARPSPLPSARPSLFPPARPLPASPV